MEEKKEYEIKKNELLQLYQRQELAYTLIKKKNNEYCWYCLEQNWNYEHIQYETCKDLVFILNNDPESNLDWQIIC